MHSPDVLTGEIVLAPPALRAEVDRPTESTREHYAAKWFLSLESDNTIAAYRRDVALYFRWCDENGVDALAVTPVLADGYRRWLKPDYPKNATRARKISVASSFHRFLRRRYPDRFGTNPFADSKRPKVSKRSETVGLTMEQALRLFDVAQRQGSWDHCMVQVLLGTGMRVSELVHARTWHVRREGDYTTIQITRKGDTTDRVPLPEDAARAIRTHVGSRTGPILQGRGDVAATRQEIARRLERLARTAGSDLPKLTPHCLRHTAATLAIAAGEPIERVQEMLGHESITTTMRYYHAMDSVQNSAVHGLAAAFERARREVKA